MDKDEVIIELRKLASRLGENKTITLKDIRTVPKLSYWTSVHFDKLVDALEVAGLPSSDLASKMSITNERLLEYLKDLEKDLGRRPTTLDLKRDAEIYKKFSANRFSPNIFKTRFNGFTNALKQLDIQQSPKTPEITIAKKGKDDPEYFNNKGRFFGEGAELHVTAELLYRGFQAANIPVDEGLDILAVRNNKTFYFQVKHKDLNNNLPISITKSSYERTGSGAVYYIFVLLSEKKREFLIVPYHIIDDWIRQDLAEEEQLNYLFYIKKIGQEYKLKNVVLDKYLDGWESIR